MNNPTTDQTRELETEIYQGTLEQRIAALGQLCAQLGPHPRCLLPARQTLPPQAVLRDFGISDQIK